MEVLTTKKPIQQMKNIQIRPPVPPLTRPMVATLRQNSHEAMRIMEKPRMDKKRKFLCALVSVRQPVSHQKK